MSILESFSGRSSNRQLVALSAAGALILALLLVAYFVWVRTPYKVLFDDMRPADAGAVVKFLEDNGVRYELKDAGTTILVPGNLVDTTRLEIANSDLPINGAVGFELFNRSDMGLTEFAQRINYQRALQGELARTIMSIETIESARVHLTMPEQTVFREDRRPTKASISLTPRKGATISGQTVAGIQRLVAAAVPDLEAGRVVIVDDLGHLLGGAQTAEESAPLTERQAVEQFYAARAHRVLSDVFPAETFRIQVSALGTGEALSPTGLVRWSPDNRQFALHVTIFADSSLEPNAQEEVRDYVAEALKIDPQVGDVVTFDAGTMPMPPEEAVGAPSAPSGGSSLPAADERRLSDKAVIIAAVASLLITLVVLAAFMLGRRGRASGPLGAEGRSDLIRRLRTALGEGSGDATEAA